MIPQPFLSLCNEDPATIRGFIHSLELACKEDPRLIEIPIQHHFSDGIYAREMRVKAGSMIVGKIHRRQNLNILSQGEVSVLTERGVKRVKAPHTFVAPPGAKRVIYAHTDCVWTVIHGTTLTDLAEIEREFITDDYADVRPPNELSEGAL